MKKAVSNIPHVRLEHPDYTGGTPEKPGLSHEAVGTTKEGAEIHGSAKQPWIE